jgi:ATP-dependent DNA helicase RecG
MTASRDGFVIAERDLALRGPGEFLGTAQHGLPPLRAGNIATDLRLIELAREAARALIAQDPVLRSPGHAVLRAELIRQYGGKFSFLKIG